MNPFSKSVRDTEDGALLVTMWAAIIGGGIVFGCVILVLSGLVRGI